MGHARTRVLVLDDDETFLQELGESLRLMEYDVVSTGDTDGFLQLVKHVKPDVVLIDLKMPKKTGFLVAYELREIAEAACLPIIAMSAYIREEYEPLLSSCGIRKCLKKPFTLKELAAEIDESARLSAALTRAS
ncbi:MAG: response regulator [Deltaproteobacteria bacterium]